MLFSPAKKFDSYNFKFTRSNICKGLQSNFRYNLILLSKIHPEIETSSLAALWLAQYLCMNVKCN